MKTGSAVLTFQHPDDFDDPLTSVLCDGAPGFWPRRLTRKRMRSWLRCRTNGLPMAAPVWCGTAMVRSVRSRRGSAQFRCGAPSCATVVAMQQARWAAIASPSPRRSCRNGRGGRRASMPCCRFSTCAASRPAISRRRFGAARQGRAEPVAFGDRPAERGVDGGL